MSRLRNTFFKRTRINYKGSSEVKKHPKYNKIQAASGTVGGSRTTIHLVPVWFGVKKVGTPPKLTKIMWD